MKFLGFLVSVGLVSLTVMALGQSNAQPTFDSLKVLAGSWEGTITTVPENTPVQGKHVQVTLRVGSTGNAILHEITWTGRQDDEISVLYIDANRVVMTHYCDVPNRPQMVAKASADGKTIEFDLLEIAGSVQYGHVQHVLFTLVDAGHHTEDWTYMGPGGDLVRGHLNLQRVK